MDRFVYTVSLAWVNLAEAIIGVFTFGYYYPRWDMKLASWYALRDIEKRKRKWQGK